MDTSIHQALVQCAFDFEALSTQPFNDFALQINPIPQHLSPLKFCRGCNQHKPATTEYFWSDQPKPDHLYTLCKKCKTPEGKARRDREKALNAPPEGFRKCTACDDIKPATTEYFDLRDAKRGTLHSECKPCKAERWQRYLERHPGYWRNVYQSDPEYHKARVCEHYRQHAEKRRAYTQNYYRLHADACRATARAYSKNNPEKGRIQASKRRALARQVGGTFTKQDIQTQRQRQREKCYYCHKKMDKYHIDHVVPLSKGGSNDPSNLVLACPTCNLKKHDKLLHEWLDGGRLC